MEDMVSFVLQNETEQEARWSGFVSTITERGPLNLVSTIVELLGKKKFSGSGLENREYGRRDPSLWLNDTPLPPKVGPKFADNQRSLGRYSSLANSSHGVSYILDQSVSFWTRGRASLPGYFLLI
jgi:hypothetical protein